MSMANSRVIAGAARLRRWEIEVREGRDQEGLVLVPTPRYGLSSPPPTTHPCTLISGVGLAAP